MKKVYQNRRPYIILLIAWIIIIGAILLRTTTSHISLLFLLGMISEIIALLTIPQILSKRIEIDNIGMLESENKFCFLYKEVKNNLPWYEIGHIIDDYIEPILFYPRYKLHIFHVMPRDNVKKPFRRISISWWIKDYKGLLSEIVSRVGPNTQIDQYIFTVLEKYKKQQKQGDSHF